MKAKPMGLVDALNSFFKAQIVININHLSVIMEVRVLIMCLNGGGIYGLWVFCNTHI